jgi:hypothetical protein
MTPAAEPSFIMTLIPIFLGGVVSSVLTLLLGQPLQHYFWRRQREDPLFPASRSAVPGVTCSHDRGAG